MGIQEVVSARSNAACEICGAAQAGEFFSFWNDEPSSADNCLHLCGVCSAGAQTGHEIDKAHWRGCLQSCAWSEIPAAQAFAYMMLRKMNEESWALSILDQIYLTEEMEVLAGAGAGKVSEHRDSNGAVLAQGDSVTLIKDLEVKGANFTAKRGCLVKNIKLADGNPEHIEGKVNGQHIVILCKFVKKA
jgi:protein PhnA